MYTVKELQTIATHMAKNLILLVPGVHQLRQGRRGDDSVVRHYDEDWVQRRSAQLSQLLESYCEIWGDFGWLAGRTALEIGSGPDLMIPYALCALGAAEATASDVGPCGVLPIPDEAIKAFEEITRRHSPSDAIASFADSDPKVRALSHVYAEDLTRSLAPESVDLIVSSSVLEHVEDAEKGIAEMFSVLRPGGRMIHAIATGNHCCGDSKGESLGHLIYSQKLWRAMFSQRVGHNRLRWFQWKAFFESAGFVLDKALVTRSMDADKLSALRPRFAEPFRSMQLDELAPVYVVAACSKPG